MDQNEYDSNWYPRETDWRLDVGRAEHREDEKKVSTTSATNAAIRP